MSSYNPFLINNTNNNTSTFGINNNNSNNLNIFGTNSINNNNNKLTSTLFGNPNNISFGANNNTNNNNSSMPSFLTNNNNSFFGNTNNANNNLNNNSIFGNTNNTNNSVNITNNNQNNLFTSNNNNFSLFPNNNNQNNTNNIQGSNNNINSNNIINNKNIFGINNNNLFNLSGINNDSNNNNIFNGNNNQQNNNIFQNQNLNLNNQEVQRDLREFKQTLFDVEKCMKTDEKENMFKDYLYMVITKGKTPSEVNVYKPYTLNRQEKILNDYNLWDEGNKKNKKPNEFFPIQISSVDALLNRNKRLEKANLINIADNAESIKTLEILKRKIEEDMNNKLINLKNCLLRVDELELSLTSKIGQYNYLNGSAKENVTDTKEIKENIKKTNDYIKDNNIFELCQNLKKTSSNNFEGEKHNYIKDMNKDRINNFLDGLIEIQNMMNIIYNENKKQSNIIMGAQKEFDRLLHRNDN